LRSPKRQELGKRKRPLRQDFCFSVCRFGPTLPGVLIGRVIGNVVATQKVESHVGRKILIVQPLNLDGTDRGEPILALDSVDAGFGERVLLTTEGFSAMTAVGRRVFAARGIFVAGKHPAQLGTEE